MKTDVWNVDASGDWSDSDNWSLGVPSDSDVVEITIPFHTITYDSASPSVSLFDLFVGKDNLLIDDSGATLSVENAASFGGYLIVEDGTLDLGLVNAKAAGFEQSGGTLAGTGTLAVKGDARFESGGIDQQTGSGTTVLKGKSTDTGAIALDGGRRLVNHGQFKVGGGAAFYLGENLSGASLGGATIVNADDGGFNFQSATLIDRDAGSGVTKFVNAGLLEQTVTTGTTSFNVLFGNYATVAVHTGTMQFNAGGFSTGVISVAPGAAIDFDGAIFTLAGPINGNGVVLLSGGALKVAANVTIASKFEQTGGVIASAPLPSGDGATLTLSGAASFSGLDQETGRGTTLLKGKSSDAGTIALDAGYMLENAGIFNLVAGGGLSLGYNPSGSKGGGIVRNDAGATFNIQTAATLAHTNLRHTAFANFGTVEQTLTKGTTDFDVAFENAGTVNVKSGVFQFNAGGSSNNGIFEVAKSAAIDFHGGATGAKFVSFGDTFSGAGAVQVSGGVFSVNASSQISSDFKQTGGVIAGPAALTLSGAASFSGTDQETGGGKTLLLGETDDSGVIALDGGRLMENAGVFNMLDGASFDLGVNEDGPQKGDATIRNDKGAIFNLQAATTFARNAGSGVTEFINKGTLSQSVTSGTSTIGVTFVNSSAVFVETGTINFSGGGSSNKGVYNTELGATIEFSGLAFTLSRDSFSGEGKTAVLGGELDVQGKSTIASDFQAVNATLDLADDALILDGGDANLSLSTIDGSHALYLESQTTEASGLTINGAAQVFAEGNVTQSGGSVTFGQQTALEIDKLGAWEIADDSSLLGDSMSTSTVTINQGLLEKSGGSGTSVVAPGMLNNGTLQVSSGTLDVKGAVTGTGSDIIANASTLEFDGAVAADQTIQFAGDEGTLYLSDPSASQSALIAGFVKGDAINLLGSWTIDGFDHDALILGSQGNAITLTFGGNYTKDDFVTSFNGTVTTVSHA